MVKEPASNCGCLSPPCPPQVDPTEHPTKKSEHTTIMPGGRHEHMQAWSPEEDHLIIDGVKMHGHQWRLIVQQLPGRSVSSTRNRFNRIEKGRHMQEEGKRGRNLCHACWLPKKGHICTKKMNGDSSSAGI